MQTGLIVMLGATGNAKPDLPAIACLGAGGRACTAPVPAHRQLELQQPDMVDKLRQSLLANGLQAQALGIEISEQALFNASPELVQTLNQLRGLGLEISLGDSGQAPPTWACCAPCRWM